MKLELKGWNAYRVKGRAYASFCIAWTASGEVRSAEVGAEGDMLLPQGKGPKGSVDCSMREERLVVWKRYTPVSLQVMIEILDPLPSEISREHDTETIESFPLPLSQFRKPPDREKIEANILLLRGENVEIEINMSAFVFPVPDQTEPEICRLIIVMPRECPLAEYPVQIALEDNVVIPVPEGESASFIGGSPGNGGKCTESTRSVGFYF